MRRAHLQVFEREFDPDRVAVVGRPQALPGRQGSGKHARYLPGALDREPEQPPEVAAEPPAPTFSQAELDAAVGEAEARAGEAAAAAAREEAREEAANDLTAAQAAAVQDAVRQLSGLQAAFDQAVTELRQQARTLVLEVARAVIPRALERAPLADVEHLLQDVVPRLGAEPKLQLLLAPDLVAAGQETFERIATESGFRGEIEVTADPDLGPGDARLRWDRGEAERSVDELVETALEIAAGWLESPSTEARQQAETGPAEPEAEDLT